MNPKIKFSILVPSVPSRLTSHLQPLLSKLQQQVDARDCREAEVEILIFLDNKQRSIGAKRNDLVDLAQGEYLAFVDDDDDVSDDYVNQILLATKQQADVIVFDQQVLLNDDPPRWVRFGIEFENEEIREPGTVSTRKPFHCCVWRSAIAKQGRFSNKQWGEDWDWVQQVLPLVQVQRRIDSTLHSYRYSDKTTEAK